jgi:hypothetical protein
VKRREINICKRDTCDRMKITIYVCVSFVSLTKLFLLHYLVEYLKSHGNYIAFVTLLGFLNISQIAKVMVMTHL